MPVTYRITAVNELGDTLHLHPGCTAPDCTADDSLSVTGRDAAITAMHQRQTGTYIDPATGRRMPCTVHEFTLHDHRMLRVSNGTQQPETLALADVIREHNIHLAARIAKDGHFVQLRANNLDRAEERLRDAYTSAVMNHEHGGYADTAAIRAVYLWLDNRLDLLAMLEKRHTAITAEAIHGVAGLMGWADYPDLGEAERDQLEPKIRWVHLQAAQAARHLEEMHATADDAHQQTSRDVAYARKRFTELVSY